MRLPSTYGLDVGAGQRGQAMDATEFVEDFFEGQKLCHDGTLHPNYFGQQVQK
jgi:hypothetical protein